MPVWIDGIHKKLIGFAVPQAPRDNERPNDPLWDSETIVKSFCFPGSDGGAVNGTLGVPNVRRHNHLALLGDGYGSKDVRAGLDVVLRINVSRVENDPSLLVAYLQFNPDSHYVERPRGKGVPGFFIGQQRL